MTGLTVLYNNEWNHLIEICFIDKKKVNYDTYAKDAHSLGDLFSN